MRVHLVSAVLGGALILGTIPTRVVAADDLTAAVTQVTIGAGVLRQDYREFNDGLIPSLRSILDFEKGNLATVQVGGGILRRGFFVEGHMTIASGDTVYDGFLQDPGPPAVYTPYIGTTSNIIFNLHARVGYPFRPVENLALIPYLEIGEHYWWRDVGYVEEYTHLLLGFGGKLLWSPVHDLVVDVGAGFGKTLLPTMTSDGDTFDLGSRAYRAGRIALDYRVAGQWHVRLSGEYRNWQYGQSPWVQVSPTTASIEPRSETTQVTYLLAVGYSFAK